MLRNGLMLGFLGFILLLTALLSLNLAQGLFAPIRWLGQYEAAHIVMHFLIFAGAMILADPRQRNTIGLWVIVLGGGVLLEAIQFVLGGGVTTRAALNNIMLDIAVDTMGAVTGWCMMQRSPTPPRML